MIKRRLKTFLLFAFLSLSFSHHYLQASWYDYFRSKITGKMSQEEKYRRNKKRVAILSTVVVIIGGVTYLVKRYALFQVWFGASRMKEQAQQEQLIKDFEAAIQTKNTIDDLIKMFPKEQKLLTSIIQKDTNVFLSMLEADYEFDDMKKLIQTTNLSSSEQNALFKETKSRVEIQTKQYIKGLQEAINSRNDEQEKHYKNLVKRFLQKIWAIGEDTNKYWLQGIIKEYPFLLSLEILPKQYTEEELQKTVQAVFEELVKEAIDQGNYPEQKAKINELFKSKFSSYYILHSFITNITKQENIYSDNKGTLDFIGWLKAKTYFNVV
ncbi:MAG: hypothetical protein AAF770_01660 [Bacteroidota bacterium]